MQWWDQLQASLGPQSCTGHCLQKAACDFEMRQSDGFRNHMREGVGRVESQSDWITAVCMTKDIQHRIGHHGSWSFNRVNGPDDGPHPGWRDRSVWVVTLPKELPTQMLDHPFGNWIILLVANKKNWHVLLHFGPFGAENYVWIKTINMMLTFWLSWPFYASIIKKKTKQDAYSTNSP